MSAITVLSPVHEEGASQPVELAPRAAPAQPVTIAIVENSKPNAKALLGHVADRLRDRFDVAEVIVHSKPGASKPIDADEAETLAARAHMVISGIGD